MAPSEPWRSLCCDCSVVQVWMVGIVKMVNGGWCCGGSSDSGGGGGDNEGK